jgi:hypothetical protein
MHQLLQRPFLFFFTRHSRNTLEDNTIISSFQSHSDDSTTPLPSWHAATRQWLPSTCSLRHRRSLLCGIRCLYLIKHNPLFHHILVLCDCKTRFLKYCLPPFFFSFYTVVLTCNGGDDVFGLLLLVQRTVGIYCDMWAVSSKRIGRHVAMETN